MRVTKQASKSSNRVEHKKRRQNVELLPQLTFKFEYMWVPYRRRQQQQQQQFSVYNTVHCIPLAYRLFYPIFYKWIAATQVVMKCD